MKWKFGEWKFGSPAESGCYAVITIWDAREGGCIGAAEWTGEKWERDMPVVSYAGPFPDNKTALDWAYDNDPDRV